MDKSFLLIVLLLPVTLLGQEQRKMTLEEAVLLATQQSLKSQSVDYQYESGQWQYHSFKRSYMPSISLSGTLPSVTRRVEGVLQDNGTESYKSRSQANSNLKLDVDQKIGLTGGTLSLSSSLERLDNFSDPEFTNWLSNPISIGIVQPLFKFNAMKWELKEQPLSNEKAMLEYSENKEDVARDACNLYYDLLSSQMVMDMAYQNMTYNDTIFQLSKGRFELGKIAENELLQIELSKLNSEIRYQQTKLRHEINNLKLRNYLGVVEEVTILPEFSDSVPEIEVNLAKAMSMALQYNSSIIALELQRLQGEKQIDQAKANKRLNVDLFAQYGLTQQSDSAFGDVYKNPTENQLLSVGFRIPILNWGANTAQYKAAVMNNNKLQADYKMAMLSFQEQIFEKVKSFEIQKAQFGIAKKANQVAEKRYFIAQKRYLIGKITTTDLNIATQERDQAKTDYINNIKSYWSSYYELRKLTHYDFFTNQVIDYNYDFRNKE